MKLTKYAEFLMRFAADAERMVKTTKMEVMPKGDDYDLVTNLDLEIERMFNKAVAAEFPGFVVIGEEFSIEQPPTDKYFLIDPIDGTVNFANGIPLWGIQASCVVAGQTVAAVINLPAYGEMYVADENGAYLNGEKLNAADKREKPLKNCIYGFDGSALSFADAMKKFTDIGCRGKNMRRVHSTSVGFAFTAAGRFSAYAFLGDKIVETVGLFLCERAGCTVNIQPGNYWAANSGELIKLLK